LKIGGNTIATRNRAFLRWNLSLQNSSAEFEDFVVLLKYFSFLVLLKNIFAIFLIWLDKYKKTVSEKLYIKQLP